MTASRPRAGTLAAAAVALVAMAAASPPAAGLQFVFTSDAHYGLTRPAFRGARNVDAHVVNAALVAAINTLSAVRFPKDGGVRSGVLVGPLDFVAEGGDVANRQEVVDGLRIQPAAVSWRQFVADYIGGIHAPVFVVPGNHDVSNAVGFYRPMSPPTDRTALVEIFNRMTLPAVARTTSTYDVQKERVFFTRDVGGVPRRPGISAIRTARMTSTHAISSRTCWRTRSPTADAWMPQA